MKTVLIVDASEDIREVTTQLLEDLGLETRCAESSLDALAQIDAGLIFDMAIIDAHVDQGIDGVELMSAIHARYPQVALVVTSADRFGQDETRRVDVQFLPKPFSRQQLLKVIAKAEGLFAYKEGP